MGRKKAKNTTSFSKRDGEMGATIELLIPGVMVNITRLIHAYYGMDNKATPQILI